MRKGIIPHVWPGERLTPVIVCDFTNISKNGNKLSPEHSFVITNDPHTRVLFCVDLATCWFLSSSESSACSSVTFERYEKSLTLSAAPHTTYIRHVFMIYAKSIATDACRWGRLFCCWCWKPFQKISREKKWRAKRQWSIEVELSFQVERARERAITIIK